MKKLLTFLFLVTLLSCKCYLQQLPTQLVYADSNCVAIIPDYTPRLFIWDNCDTLIITQTPEAGSIMDIPHGTVVIKVTDEFFNADSVVFDIIKVDTIAPVITPDSSWMSYEDPFGFLDAFQAWTRPYINDSVWNSHNLVMISSPNGSHMGGWYHQKYDIITADSADLAALGYTTYRIRLKR